MLGPTTQPPVELCETSVDLRVKPAACNAKVLTSYASGWFGFKIERVVFQCRGSRSIKLLSLNIRFDQNRTGKL